MFIEHLPRYLVNAFLLGIIFIALWKEHPYGCITSTTLRPWSLVYYIRSLFLVRHVYEVMVNVSI